MSRQSEIDKIAKIMSIGNPVTDGQAIKMAEHLVDNGIGTKDRFEVEDNNWFKIIPIDYTI